MSRLKGFEAEDKAVRFLENAGFFVIERNFLVKFGEIDIIAQKEGILHFIEVKSAPSYEVAVNNITASKLSKVIKTAQFYLKKHNRRDDYVIDAIIVTPHEIELIENVTL